MTNEEKAVLDDCKVRIVDAIHALDAIPWWRFLKRDDARGQVLHEKRMLAMLQQDISNVEAGRRQAANDPEVNKVLLDCLDYFRNFDLERKDDRGPSPMIKRLLTVLARRGVEAPDFPPERTLACPEPSCDVMLPADDTWAQKAHLEAHHPEIVVQRLRDSGMHLEADEYEAARAEP